MRSLSWSFVFLAVLSSCAPSAEEQARQAQIGQARQELEDLSSALADLTQRQRQQEALLRGPASNSESFARETELENSMDRLQSVREARRRINESTALDRQALAADASAVHAQVEIEMQTVAADIVRAQSRLRTNAAALANTPEVRAEADELTLQLAALQQRLDDLRAQRTWIAASLADRTRSAANTAEARKSALEEDEISLSEEITSLRNENSVMFRTREEAQADLLSINRQLQETQDAYNQKSQRVRELEQTIR